ncbi:MAG: imidazole glycerol phosphate synthase subunit HisF [Bacteroidetes bacterium]|nr:imidazole glycerol phosphate synthase subunit HisF [Bacteroidota bacterium]
MFPVLLLTGSGLIKTKQFRRYKYLGDVINTLKIFNELAVDELCIFGLDPNQKSKPIDFPILKKISREASMPLCYGGGVASVDDAKRLIDLGYEKISLNTVLFNNFEVVNDIIKAVGGQSVVATIDYKVNVFGKMIAYSHCGLKKQGTKVEELVKKLNSIGVAEIVFQSIDRDGMRSGFDIDRLIKIKSQIKCQMSLVGGCASSRDIHIADSTLGPLGIGVGSHFVFNGKLDAVLISYQRD